MRLRFSALPSALRTDPAREEPLVTNRCPAWLTRKVGRQVLVFDLLFFRFMGKLKVSVKNSSQDFQATNVPIYRGWDRHRHSKCNS